MRTAFRWLPLLVTGTLGLGTAGFTYLGHVMDGTKIHGAGVPLLVMSAVSMLAISALMVMGGRDR